MANTALCIGLLLATGNPAVSASRSTEANGHSVAVMRNGGAGEVFVDGTSGSDSKSGTLAHPVRTIARASELAIANYRNKISTIITINPGIYRESIQLLGDVSEGDASITLEASTIGTVVVSGSDLWTGWTSDSDNPEIYSHSWPYHWGACSPPPGWPALQEIVLRREMIFVNGVLLAQVLSQAQLREGSFFVDEAAQRAYIWPSRETDIAKASVEVSTRPVLFESQRVSTVTLRGLEFEHANSCVSTKPAVAVAISDGTNHLVEDCKFDWNNWAGFAYYGVTDSAVRRIEVNHNGELGMNGYKLRRVTLEDVETSYNNWRGAWGAFTTWEAGGAKFLRVHGGMFTNYRAVGNQGRGIWFDTDNTDITFRQGLLAHNLKNGLFIEKNQGPISITDSQICGNRAEGVLTNSESVTLAGNFIYDNEASQIYVDGRGGVSKISDWETGASYEVVAQKLSLLHNTVISTGPDVLLIEMSHPTAESSSLFFATLHSDDNTWYNSTNQNGFQFDPGGQSRRARVFDLSQWQSVTGQDKNSTFGPSRPGQASYCSVP